MSDAREYDPANRAAACAARALRLISGLVLAAAMTAPVLGGELTSLEQAGKTIFLEGVSPGGRPLFARIGRDLVKVPASAVPCGGCHGPDGLGRPEGGVVPPDITWSNLTKSYGHRHPDGRSHQAFDENSLASAIRARVDPAFNGLNPAMPQYDIADEDMAALVAYIKRLEGDLDPGLSADAIRVGVVAPGPGPLRPVGQAITETVGAYFQEVNAAGGLYGRALELVVVERTADPAETAAAVEGLLETNAVFAMVASFAVGVEQGLFDVLASAGVPNVGPIALNPVSPGHGAAAAFLVVSGLAEQAQALLAFSASRRDAPSERVAVAHSGVPEMEVVLRAVQAEARKRGLPEPLAVELDAGGQDIARAAADLKSAGADALIYLGGEQDLWRLAEAAAAAEWRPRLLLTGQLSARAAFGTPAAFGGEVFLSYPNLPTDRSSEGIAELRRLTQSRSAETGHLATRVSALAAAKLLVEGLRRAGRDVSRAKLARALEGVTKFETGLTPPISFGPNRRVGARGAHILGVDLKSRSFDSTSVWISLD